MEGTGNGKVETNQGNITTIIRALVGALGLCILGILSLLHRGLEVPNELWMLTGSLATGLAPMLVKTSPTTATAHTEPQPAGNVHVPAQILETRS